MPTPIEQLAAYAMAFEQTFADDDWSRLTPHFAPDAEREVLGGGSLAYHSVGRAQVIDDLHRNVADMDRRFDLRIPEVTSGPDERDGAVWMSWRLTLRRAGLPDLIVAGSHGTWHRDGLITRIEEHVSDEVGAAVEAYLTKHDTALRPAPPAEPMRIGRMRSLVETYARAKSRADIAGAMAVCADGFVLDTRRSGSRHGTATRPSATSAASSTPFPTTARSSTRSRSAPAPWARSARARSAAGAACA